MKSIAVVWGVAVLGVAGPALGVAVTGVPMGVAVASAVAGSVIVGGATALEDAVGSMVAPAVLSTEGPLLNLFLSWFLFLLLLLLALLKTVYLGLCTGCVGKKSQGIGRGTSTGGSMNT